MRWKFSFRYGERGERRDSLIFNGEKFVQTWTPRVRSQVEFDNATRSRLTIKDVELNDSGMYTCIEKIPITETLPITFELIVSKSSITANVLVTG